MQARTLGVLLLAALLVPSFASAQTVINPVQGSYESIYVLAGRVVDAEGAPAAGAILVIDVEGRGVKAEPFRARANCFGDFIATFNIGFIDPTTVAKVRVIPKDPNATSPTDTVKLDPFFRRSDMLFELPGFWPSECPEQTENWPGRLSVTGRVINRTAEYEANGTTFHAKPYRAALLVWYVDPDGFKFCPPAVNGGCDAVYTDERGDFRYSFTFPEVKPSRGHFEIHIDDKVFNTTVDPDGRLGVAMIETTGQGRPTLDTPAPGFLAMLVGALVVAVASRSVLGRHRR